MAKRAKEDEHTCRVCSRRFVPVKGRMPEHYWSNGFGQDAQYAPCAGSGHQSIETAAARQISRENSRKKKRAKLCDPFRPYAAVALDAVLSKRPYPKLDLDILRYVALADYRGRFGRAAFLNAEFRFVTKPGISVGDCYCTFCGVLCLQRVRVKATWDEAMTERLAKLAEQHEHPIACGLKHLAFALEPADPKLRRLPEDMLRGADEEPTAEMGGAA